MVISKDIAVKKITEMSKEQVSKVLIFMAGMEAEHTIKEQNDKTKELQDMLKESR